MDVRPTKAGDLPFLAKVLDETHLFPSELLADMAGGFLSDADSDDLWLTCEMNGAPVGFCYAVPERLTEGTWNMLAIAVQLSRQRSGVGAAIVRHLERTLQERGHRLMIVETSDAPEFDRAREFYGQNGYSQEARIRDFWSVGNDKIIFWKRL